MYFILCLRKYSEKESTGFPRLLKKFLPQKRWKISCLARLRDVIYFWNLFLKHVRVGNPPPPWLSGHCQPDFNNCSEFKGAEGRRGGQGQGSGNNTCLGTSPPIWAWGFAGISSSRWQPLLLKIIIFRFLSFGVSLSIFSGSKTKVDLLQMYCIVFSEAQPWPVVQKRMKRPLLCWL